MVNEPRRYDCQSKRLEVRSAKIDQTPGKPQSSVNNRVIARFQDANVTVPCCRSLTGKLLPQNNYVMANSLWYVVSHVRLKRVYKFGYKVRKKSIKIIVWRE